MFSPIKQTLVLIRSNLLSLPRRWAISMSMSLSIALVVCVLAGFLSLAKGFETALNSAGSAEVAVILGGGTNQETGSEIPASAIRTLEATSGALGVIRDVDGTPMLSREIVVPVAVQQSENTDERTLTLRGMDVTGLPIREEITLSAGRFFAPGAPELVVGESLGRDFPDFQIGHEVRLGTVNWTVVGHFSAGGSAFESEIWSNLDAVHSAFDLHGQVQSLRLRLSDTASLDELQRRLDTIPDTPLLAVSEATLYAAQSGRTGSLIRLFGWPLALLMAIGATAGAINTMMNSVADRTVEVATVRALGFSRFSTCLATWAEAVALAATGVVCGVLVSWLCFNGWHASTIGANNTSLTFQMAVTGDVMVTAGLLGLLIGVAGGAIPAFAATRLPLTAALRANS